MPPTSRPPMALGCPVSENGPAPGRPIWPVARCRLISAALLCGAVADWFSPWQYSDSVAVDAPNHCAACTMSAAGTPQSSAAAARRVFAHGLLQRLEALGVRADVVEVAQPLPQHHVQHRVVQRDVGAGQDRQVQIRRARGVGAARIDDDDLDRRVALARSLDAPEQNRVRTRHVGAGDEQALGALDVLVAGGRRIGAQRHLVAGDRARHAQPRIGVDVVGADQTLGQLVEDVVVLGEELAGNVERDRIRAHARG